MLRRAGRRLGSAAMLRQAARRDGLSSTPSDALQAVATTAEKLYRGKTRAPSHSEPVKGDKALLEEEKESMQMQRLQQALNDSSISNKSSKLGNNSLGILSFLGDLDGGQKDVVNKLINFRMIGGKKTKTRAILYNTFHRLARNERDAIKLTSEAVENIKPVCEVSKTRIGSVVYDVPGIIGTERQQALAIRWLFDAASKRRTSCKISLEKCLFDEILDAHRKRGGAHTKKETIHGVAASNRSYAHYRWW